MAGSLEVEVGARLRAIMVEFSLLSNKKFGDFCGASNSAVNNWRCGYNLPRVPEMIRLCERTGATLDWLYRGYVGSMDPELAIKLSRRAAVPAAQTVSDRLDASKQSKRGGGKRVSVRGW